MRHILLTLVLLLSGFAAQATQPLGVRLMDINDSGELRDIFNSEKGKVRLLAILSPT